LASFGLLWFGSTLYNNVLSFVLCSPKFPLDLSKTVNRGRHNQIKLAVCTLLLVKKWFQRRWFLLLGISVSSILNFMPSNPPKIRHNNEPKRQGKCKPNFKIQILCWAIGTVLISHEKEDLKIRDSCVPDFPAEKIFKLSIYFQRIYKMRVSPCSDCMCHCRRQKSV
jgi:hypothetical protein